MDKPTFNYLLGGFIRSKREEIGWTQSDLASRIGNNSQNVSAIERGIVSPTLYWCSEILAPALNMTSIDFLTEFEKFKQAR